MPATLDYASRSKAVRLLPVLAMVVGLVSGPAAYRLAIFSAANHLPEPTKETLMLLSLAIVLGGIFLFSFVVRLSFTDARRDRVFANIGIVAPAVWSLVIFWGIMYALSRV